MHSIHTGNILFYDQDENPSDNWQILARANLAFVIQPDGSFLVAKDRYSDHRPGTKVDGDEVERMMQQFLDFEASTQSLKDLVRDNKGLNFLGISARSDSLEDYRNGNATGWKSVGLWVL
jgi:hypothetical protein